MVVLVLIVSMVTQLVGGASLTTNLQRQRLDGDRQARLIFDRMAADFAGMVRRPNVDCSAYRYSNYRNGGTTAHFKRAGNDSILFFAEADSQNAGSTLSSDDGISLIGYRVFDRPTATSTATAQQSTDASFRLERLGQGFGWSESSPAGFGMPFLNFNGTNPPAGTITTYWPSFDTYNAAGQNCGDIPQSHVLGEEVFRMEFALLMKDQQPDGSYFLKSASQGIGYLDYTDPKQQAFKGVSAIVVTIALLDQQSRARLGASDARYQALASVAGKLVDGDNADVASQWAHTLITDITIPRAVSANAYVYQRYFYLR